MLLFKIFFKHFIGFTQSTIKCFESNENEDPDLKKLKNTYSNSFKNVFTFHKHIKYRPKV